MKTAKVPIKHADIYMDAIFAVINVIDTPALYNMLLNNGNIIQNTVLKFLMQKIFDFYDIDANYETIELCVFQKKTVCITIIPEQDLSEDEVDILTKTILPMSLTMPIWNEWNELELLNALTIKIDEYLSQSNSLEKKSPNQLYTFIIPSLSALMNFASLHGQVVEQDGRLYLQTPDDLSEFFERCYRNIKNTRTVVDNVEDMLCQINEVER